MRKLILRMQYSLDGFVSGPDGDLQWIFSNLNAESATRDSAQLAQAGAHLMGSVTYRDMAAHWPTSTEPYAPPMNQIPKIVFSRSLKSAPWGPTRILSGDLAEEITRLKQEPGGDLMAHGGVRFAQSLVRTGLIDEYWLNIHPNVLGHGQRLFPELPVPVKLKLANEHRYGTGVIATVYRVAA